MGVSPRAVLRALVIGVVLALAVPAIAFGQSQTGTSGNGNGSQSGGVTNNQSNTQNGSGSNVQQNATNQNCVAGRDCVNNNITNQNQNTTAAPARVFERAPVAVRRVRVRTVALAHTGADMRLLLLVGGLMAAGGLGVLMTVRRRSSSLLT